MKTFFGILTNSAITLMALAQTAIFADWTCEPVNEYYCSLQEVRVMKKDGFDYIEMKVLFDIDGSYSTCVCGHSTPSHFDCSYAVGRAIPFWFTIEMDGTSRMDYIASVLLRENRPTEITILTDAQGQVIGISY